MFEKHKAKKAHEQFESALAAWQAERNELASVLELASGRTVGKSSTVMLKSSESVFGSISGVGLVEIRKVGGHFEGGSAGVSVPIGTINGRSVRYRVGKFRGHYVEGTPQPQATDRGTLTITNQRFVYMGSSHSIECLFTKLVGIQRFPGALSVSVSNRQKPSMFSYGAALDDWVTFRLDLALALFNGQASQFTHEITKQLAELDARKPQDPSLPPQSADSASRNAPDQEDTVTFWLLPDERSSPEDNESETHTGFTPFFDEACTQPIPLSDSEPFTAGAIHCSVHGISYHSEDAQRPEFDVGAQVRLVPEPDNPVDPLAIKVVAESGSTTLCAGYVPAELAHMLLPLDEGEPGGAVVIKTYSRAGKRVGLRIAGGVGNKEFAMRVLASAFNQSTKL
jgi:hypothetical protein